MLLKRSSPRSPRRPRCCEYPSASSDGSSKVTPTRSARASSQAAAAMDQVGQRRSVARVPVRPSRQPALAQQLLPLVHDDVVRGADQSHQRVGAGATAGRRALVRTSADKGRTACRPSSEVDAPHHRSSAADQRARSGLWSARCCSDLSGVMPLHGGAAASARMPDGQNFEAVLPDAVVQPVADTFDVEPPYFR